MISSSKLTAESEPEASEELEGSEGEIIRNIYTTIATYNYPHNTLLNTTMLATAEYSDIRCWLQLT